MDLVATILLFADADPIAFVGLTRVSKVWRAACCSDERLLLAAARKPDFLTKHTFAGLFALTMAEADAFPRGMRARRQGGVMFMYREAAIAAVLPAIGGIDGWRRRLSKRARVMERAVHVATERRGWWLGRQRALRFHPYGARVVCA